MTWTNYENSDGDTTMDEAPIKVSINSHGIVSLDDTIGTDTTFHGVMSDDKRMVVATMTDGGGGSELIVLQKSGGTFAPRDLEGEWNMHSLSSGNSGHSGWVHCTVKTAVGIWH